MQVHFNDINQIESLYLLLFARLETETLCSDLIPILVQLEHLSRPRLCFRVYESKINNQQDSSLANFIEQPQPRLVPQP